VGQIGAAPLTIEGETIDAHGVQEFPVFFTSQKIFPNRVPHRTTTKSAQKDFQKTINVCFLPPDE
jgi:hypothetical protein